MALSPTLTGVGIFGWRNAGEDVAQAATLHGWVGLAETLQLFLIKGWQINF